MGLSLGTPTPDDIRARIEGYGFDALGTLNKTGTFLNGATVITGISTIGIRPFMFISGAGIAAGTRVASITIFDPTNGTIVIDTPTTAPGTLVALVVTFYVVKSDEWLINTRDNFVMPWITGKTRMSYGAIKTATEFYDGTGSPILVLRKRPIVQLISISYTNVNTNFYYLTPSAVVVMADEGILKAKSNFNDSSYIPIFYRGDRNLQVVYQYGFGTMPMDVSEAVACLVAEQALASAGSKTGGGDMTSDGYNRSFGKSGKYTHERRRLAREGLAILKPYMTGVV